jgi:hypothetical protein
MEKVMTVENQENGLVKAPLIFTVPAYGLVVAARTKEFQLGRSTSEQLLCPGTQQPAVGHTHEINPQQSLRELRLETDSLKLSKVELLVFLFFGLVAAVATLGCFAELFDLLGNAVLEQTVRALLTK